MIHKIPAKKIMTPNPVCVSYLDSLEHVRYLFSVNAFHHLPVLSKENTILGIISNTDLNLCLDWASKFEIEGRNGSHERLLKSLTTMDVCTKQVFTVRVDDTLETCYQLFLHNQFHCLPVIDDENKVVGILTTYDLLKVAFEND